jgi:hypothetical protein
MQQACAGQSRTCDQSLKSRDERKREMKTVTARSAARFVDELELPGLPRGGFEAKPQRRPVDFDALKNQAVVVGSDVISFVEGVSAERREDVVNATLLAQLAANKKVADRSQVLEWYDAYFDVLTNLGWVIQEKGFNAYEEKADGLQAHEAILKVAAVVFGSAPTALAVVTSTIEAMKSMDKDNPWITIFDRESKYANTARFQVGLAQQDSTGQFMISMMAFGLEAKSTLTQVLFFKILSNKVKLKQCSGKVTINDAVLTSVREKVKSKLAGRTSGYIDALDI